MNWEYRTVKLAAENSFWGVGGKLDVTTLDQMMNDIGRDGWELVAAFDTNQIYGTTKDAVLIFKRPRDK
jgi:hypothetical protein